LPSHSKAPLLSSPGFGKTGSTPKWPQVKVVSSRLGTPKACCSMPSAEMIDENSPIHSCSLEAGTSTPSAIAARTLSSRGSGESALQCEWMWKSPQSTPVVSTERSSVAGSSTVAPAATVTVWSTISYSKPRLTTMR
jgi:hypothetical protein